MSNEILTNLGTATSTLCESLGLDPFLGDCGEIALAHALLLNRKVAAGELDKDQCEIWMMCRLGYPLRDDGEPEPFATERGVVHMHAYIEGAAIENGHRLGNYVGVDDLENFCRLRNDYSSGDEDFKHEFWLSEFSLEVGESDQELITRFLQWFKAEICFDVIGMRFEDTVKNLSRKPFLDESIALNYAKIMEDSMGFVPTPTA